SPGVTVRPIRMLDGGHEINEVWFENVEVPVANRVGEENKGWSYAKYLLSHERVGIAEVGPSKRELKRLKRLATDQMCNGRPLIEDTRFRDRIARVEIELMALEITVLRVLAAEAQGPRPESSLLKIRGSEIRQEISELAMLAIGPQALAMPSDANDDLGQLAGRYLNDRKTTIYGGRNESQKNKIDHRVLGS